ncbi:MAG: aldo/keto reductase [Acidobacteriaceae bacterium]|nr:aldo/keto reductase [Acidobacteriaceae bacterium]
MPPKSVQPPGSGFSRGAIQTPRGFARVRLAAQLTAVPGDNFERNLQLVSAIEGIAREKKCTPSQLALAWVLAQGEILCRFQEPSV